MTMPHLISDDRRWEAIDRRESAYDGVFVYAIDKTGLYCRPSCQSPRPDRSEVTFFTFPAVAEAAGYQPCPHCQPDGVTRRDPQADAVRRVCVYIEQNMDRALTLAELGEHVHFSPYHLQRVFKRVMGISPRQYAEACRVSALKSRLRDGANVTDALYDVGYGSSSRVYEKANATLGMTPSTYSKRGKDMEIFYTIVSCKLGYLLVAATERGVCAVRLGDRVDALHDDLLNEFELAHIERDDDGLQPFVQPIIDYLDGWQPHLALSLDIRATAFQWRVWQELQRIPYGETRSYGDIAEAIGEPGSARAVARAVATNPVALVIPCHRVVRKDGDLSGYRWGRNRKRAILAHEQEQRKQQDSD